MMMMNKTVLVLGLVWILGFYACTSDADQSPIPVEKMLVANDDYIVAVAEHWSVTDFLANDTILRDAGLSITRKPIYGDFQLTDQGLMFYYTYQVSVGQSDTMEYLIRVPGGESQTAMVVISVVASYEDAGCDRGAVVDFDTTFSDIKNPHLIDVLANDMYCGQSPAAQTLAIAQSGVHADVTVTDGLISYLPDSDFNGPDTVIYTVEPPDAPGTLDFGVVFLRVFQDSGCIIRASADSYSAVYREPLRLPVLDNDFFGCPKEIDWESFRVLIPPPQGSISIDGTDLLYTLSRNYRGQFVSYYEVCQKNGDCFGASFEVDVLPCPPVVTHDDSPIYGPGQIKIFDIPVLDNDEFCPNFFQTFEIVDQPKYGTVTLSLAKRNISLYELTDTDAIGELEEFSYRVCDGQGRCDTARVFFRIR